MFAEKIQTGVSGTLLYGITPPKAKTPEVQLEIIADKRSNRINQLQCDALVIYDIQDESQRTLAQRPFDFFPTLDPLMYANTYHNALACQKIIYHVVGKYTATEFQQRLIDCTKHHYLSVLVGAASKNQATRINLDKAYAIWQELPDRMGIGGVVIPERHKQKQDEHLRIIAKQGKGCDFFISQCICNLEMVKNFISDYCGAVEDQGLSKKYFVFTLTICGSVETLELMHWLGIDIPQWLKNDLSRSKDIIEASIQQNLRIAQELTEYCAYKQLNCGFNIESVSPKKSEVDATVVLYNELHKQLTAGLPPLRGIHHGS